MLECVTSIPETKEHSEKLVHTKRGYNDSLLKVLGNHRNLVITLLEVKLDKIVEPEIQDIKSAV